MKEYIIIILTLLILSFAVFVFLIIGIKFYNIKLPIIEIMICYIVFYILTFNRYISKEKLYSIIIIIYSFTIIFDPYINNLIITRFFNVPIMTHIDSIFGNSVIFVFSILGVMFGDVYRRFYKFNTPSFTPSKNNK